MKNKSSILKWFRRKKPVVFIKSHKENENVNVKKNKIINTNCTNNDEVEINKPKENTTVSPIPIITITGHERKIPEKNNDRITIIKPRRNIGIENTIEIQKEELKKKEIEEEKNINKDFTDEKTLLNDNNNIIITDTLDEIEKMLRTNYHEIKSIEYELDILEQKEKDKVITKDVEKLIEELNKLIKKFEEIKNNFYQKNFKDIYKHAYNHNYIGQIIEEYKTAIKENNMGDAVLLQVKQIEEYISLINDIIAIETKKDNLNKSLTDKKETLDIRNKDFEQIQEKYVDIEKVNNYIETFSNEYDRIIKDIENKVSNSTKITKTAEYKTNLYVNYSKLLTSTLLLSASAAIPFNRGGNILKTGLMIAAVAGIASSIKTRTKEAKVTTNITFRDYATEIRANINNVQDMSLMIDKALVDIKYIKDEFHKEFGEYLNIIPDYYKLISSLDSIEKDLLVKQNIAKELDKKLDETLEKNNTKVKRLEEEIPN